MNDCVVSLVLSHWDQDKCAIMIFRKFCALHYSGRGACTAVYVCPSKNESPKVKGWELCQSLLQLSSFIRLQAVSEICREGCKKTPEGICRYEPRAMSSKSVRRWTKRETAVVSYSNSEAWHSGDRVLLLVGLQSYDTHLSATFISDIQHMANSSANFVSFVTFKNGRRCHWH